MVWGELGQMAVEDNKADRDRLIGMFIAFLAVLLAVCSMGGSNSAKIAMQKQIEAANTWAFFQAKNLRRQAIRLQIEDLELMIANNPNLPIESKNPIFAKIASYREQDEQLTSDKKSGEGLDELFARGKALEAERDVALRQDPYFDYAQAFLQIAIVLASAAILVPQGWLLALSVVLAILGAILTVNGFTLAVTIPFIS
jgi:hypothetical protein